MTFMREEYRFQVSPDFCSVSLIVYIDASSGHSFCGKFRLCFTHHGWSCKAKQYSFSNQNVHHILEIIVSWYHIKNQMLIIFSFFIQLMINALRKFGAVKFVAGPGSLHNLLRNVAYRVWKSFQKYLNRFFLLICQQLRKGNSNQLGVGHWLWWFIIMLFHIWYNISWCLGLSCPTLLILVKTRNEKPYEFKKLLLLLCWEPPSTSCRNMALLYLLF